MQLGMVGLGRMGANMVRRLMKAGHRCVVYDRDASRTQELAREGATAAAPIDQFISALEPPRVVWVMVPAGPPTEEVLAALAERMEPGDILIDGGNSYYKDDVRRARQMKRKGIQYLDVGTSGGVWGLERGYCLMIGGTQDSVAYLDPIFRALAPGQGTVAQTPHRDRSTSTAEQGYLHCGPAGAGHFVKMVHNGIEYGVMQALAEGFDILRSARIEGVDSSLPLADIAEVWRRGSVLESWLLDLTASALSEDADLRGYTGFVEDSGEGRWTVMAAVEQAVPANVIAASLFARFRSRQDHTFADKVLSAMRYKFGGHVERPSGG
jgi:6-phosphogluconate dehydrogenase